MTKRKPPGMGIETWVDRLIEEARAEGAFDDLPGLGKPIENLDKPYDPDWWVRDCLKRNNLSFAPREFELRKKVETELSRIGAIGSEDAVRDLVAALNVEIGHHNSTTFSGPTTSVPVLDPERIVARWRTLRTEGGG